MVRIRKYDFDYGRRTLMEKVAKGIAAGGVIAPLWPLIAKAGDLSKAYPEELTEIEAHTKGHIKVGDVITADNVDHVKHLLSPIGYWQVKEDGRRIHIVEPTRDVEKLFPPAYYDATLRNAGLAAFDQNNNVVEAATGGPWIGGNPFPDPQTGLEVAANMTLSWGRRDYAQYAIRDWDIDGNGRESYQYDFVWCELNTTSRVGSRVYRDYDHLLRLTTVFFVGPQEHAGTSLFSIWPYDQRQVPDLYGFLPQFGRVRRFPADQRFEPLAPGLAFYLSDTWGSGDPLLNWGEYELVSREPHLIAASPKNWFRGITEGGIPPVHGGPRDQTYWDSYMELCPETLVWEAKPTAYPRAPVGKKRVWCDARNSIIVDYLTFDRRGEMWKSVQPASGPRDNGVERIESSDGRTEWGLYSVMFHDIQAERMSRLFLTDQVRGGFKEQLHIDTEEEQRRKEDLYLNRQALTRIGSV